MTIESRLRLLVILVSLTTVTQAGLGIGSFVHEMHGRASVREATRISWVSRQIQVSLLQHRRFEKDVLLNYGNPERKAEYLVRFRSEVGKFRKLAPELELLLDGDPRASDVARMRALHDEYIRKFDRLIEAPGTTSPAALNDAFRPDKATIYELDGIATRVTDETVQARNELIEELTEKGRFLFIVLIVFSLASVATTTTLLLRHSRYLRHGLARFGERIEDLSSARKLLAEELTWPEDDEFREIMNKMNLLLVTLRGLYARVAEGEESLDVTVRSIGDGLVAVDAEARVTRLNPVAESLTGFREAEAMGKPIEDVLRLIDGKSKEPIPVPLRVVAETGETALLPAGVILVSKVGSERHVADSMRPILGKDGERLGAVMIFRDVTDSEALELRLRHAEKMDAVGKLAGGIAHDFNNMLTGILGSTEFLHEQPLDDEARDCLSIIERSAERAAMLNSKLLAFARRGTKLSTPVHMHRIIEDVVLLMRHSLDKSVEIRTDLLAKNDLVVGDPAQIQNALLNLGINAKDAMVGGGLLVYRTTQVTFNAPPPGYEAFNLGTGSYLRVEVRDSGSGIDEQVLPHIFDPFFTTKDPGKGTGLGLASVYGTMTEHFGAVVVRSKPGQTTFELLFPSSDTSVSHAAETTRPDSERGSGRILVVEDEEMLRSIARSVLERSGYEVILAENGAEAIKLVSARADIDAVLLDMVMPVMGGRECFFKLKGIRPELPVLLASGFSHEARIQDLLDAGARAFLSKPYRASELVLAIQAAMKPKE